MLAKKEALNAIHERKPSKKGTEDKGNPPKH